MGNKVTVICYGKCEEWTDRENAKAFYLEAINGSDGSERDRYVKIYTELLENKAVCTDTYED